MKAFLATLLLALLVSGDRLPNNYHGDVYEPTGEPTGGRIDTFSDSQPLVFDPDGDGPVDPVAFEWSEALGEYITVPDGELRLRFTCAGRGIDGKCICWSWELYAHANSPPYGWFVADEGLTYD